MNPISLVIKREYLTRVRKKTFILFTILTPLIAIGISVIPALIMSNTEATKTKIGILNNYEEISYIFKDSDNIEYKTITSDIRDTYLASDVLKKEYDAILEVPENIMEKDQVKLISYKLLSFNVSTRLKSKISNAITKIKTENIVNKYDIPGLDSEFANAKTSIKIKEQIISDDGEKKDSFSGVASGVGYILGFMIYMFIFIYGGMVMQSVMEEKKNRIVEVLITSIKPFHLMLGKIIGIICVALTQILIWVSLFGLAQLFMSYGAQLSPELMQNGFLNDIKNGIEVLNLGYIVSLSIFYFLGGVLVYSSLMAAIGAAVDNQEDTQQFMFIIIAPLLIGIILIGSVIQNPTSSLSVWASIIPLTSPIVMTARIPFDVPLIELIASMLSLIVFFVLCIWFAAKIYATGILMYGKKVNFKEIWKWIRHS
ncbi:ABC transporter permease [Halosquirtibacter laminarini]|uniref:ABC transporter permease n=1 Tax=Halosquirtibacter laminarini TaxID=3374600 RepID=A0AC61NC50_9BACT|nr:ABC transporter permease [Prolixibacteraceae bacterium]